MMRSISMDKWPNFKSARRWEAGGAHCLQALNDWGDASDDSQVSSFLQCLDELAKSGSHRQLALAVQSVQTLSRYRVGCVMSAG